MKTRVIIFVSGGNVQEVRTDCPEQVEVTLFDADNLAAEGRSGTAIEKEYAAASAGTVEVATA